MWYYYQTLGLANHVIDLKVANLLIRSPRSHGLHSGALGVPAEADECCCDLSTISPLRLGSISAKADDVFGRFVPLDNWSPGELQIKHNIRKHTTEYIYIYTPLKKFPFCPFECSIKFSMNPKKEESKCFKLHKVPNKRKRKKNWILTKKFDIYCVKLKEMRPK